MTKLSDSVNNAIQEVKHQGFGEVLVKIQNHKIVYIQRTMGEQVKDE